jgi:hypothetical protein
MASTTIYDVNYKIPTGAASATALVLAFKSNITGNWSTVNTINNPAINTDYTFITSPLLSHRIYSVRVSTVCPGTPSPIVTIGDYQYLINPTAAIPLIGSAAAGPSINVSWDCYIDQLSGDSLKEYILEYKDTASVGPWYSVTIPKSTILTYWASNPYPGYAINVTTGITAATDFDVRITAVLRYDYITLTGTLPTDVVVPPTTITVTIP